MHYPTYLGKLRWTVHFCLSIAKRLITQLLQPLLRSVVSMVMQSAAMTVAEYFSGVLRNNEQRIH